MDAGAAEARVGEARSGRLPKLNYAESFARSDNPVFVFSSLLTQHQFTAANFQLGPLNRPDALSNFQSKLTLDEMVYDGGRTRQAVRSAELGREMSGEEGRLARMQVLAGAARAYYGDLLAEASLAAAQEAVRSADADLERAETVRAAGMSTDVDVLSIRVHRAEVEEQRIRRAADLDVTRAALNDAPTIGDSLCDACAEHFAQVRAYLDAYGIAYTVEPTLVRGLYYYTRTAFEFLGPDEAAQASTIFMPKPSPRKGATKASAPR